MLECVKCVEVAQHDGRVHRAAAEEKRDLPLRDRDEGVARAREGRRA